MRVLLFAAALALCQADASGEALSIRLVQRDSSKDVLLKAYFHGCTTMAIRRRRFRMHLDVSCSNRGLLIAAAGCVHVP
jgi:hypothetical protein